MRSGVTYRSRGLELGWFHEGDPRKKTGMTSAARDDFDETFVDEVRERSRPKAAEPLQPDTAEEIASLEARVEAVEASTRTISHALHELRGIVRTLNRSARHYRPFSN